MYLVNDWFDGSYAKDLFKLPFIEIWYSNGLCEAFLRAFFHGFPGVYIVYIAELNFAISVEWEIF